MTISTQSNKKMDYSAGADETHARHYHAYLMLIWREDETIPWRVQIENASTNETIGFPTLDELRVFLDRQFGRELPA